MTKTQHKQVKIKCGRLEAEVDKGIAPLILALWKLGITTTMSCEENHPGIAWIQFQTPDDAIKFLNLVAVYPKKNDKTPFWETLYGRITLMAMEGTGQNWDYHFLPEDLSEEETLIGDEIFSKCIGPANFNFAASIRFPTTDIPLILKRLKAVRRKNNARRVLLLDRLRGTW